MTVLRIYYWTGSTTLSSQQRTDNVTAGPVEFTDEEVDRITLTPNFQTTLLESWYTEPSLKSLLRPTPTTYKSPESLNLGWRIDIRIKLLGNTTKDNLDIILAYPAIWRIYYKYNLDTGANKYFTIDPNYLEERDFNRPSWTALFNMAGYETSNIHDQVNS